MTTPPAPREANPLIPIGDWHGTALGWTVGAAANSLTIFLSPAADQFQGLSPTARGDLVVLWKTIAEQSNDPSVAFSVGTTLDAGGSVALGSPTIAAFAEALLAYVQALDADTSPPPLPPPVVVDYAVGSLKTATPPHRIGVTMRVARAQTERIESDVPVMLPAGGIRDVAIAFETQFATLKLAIGGADDENVELWAADRALLALSIGQSPAAPNYFAPAPLSTSLISGTVTVPSWDLSGAPPYVPVQSTITYGAVDIDVAARQVFAALDDLFADPFATAASKVSASDYANLLAMRGRIAQAYVAKQVQWLFVEQAPRPAPEHDAALSAARACLSDELRGSLANGNAIGVIVQYLATCAAPSSAATAGLSLSGSVGSQAGASPIFHSVAATLRLPSSAGYSGEGLLSIAYKPDASLGRRVIDGVLQFEITNIALGDNPADPSGLPSWLRFPVPVTAPIGQPQSTKVPIVVREFPASPALVSQSYAPYTSPAGPTFLDQLSWNYTCQFHVEPHAADTITTVASLDEPALRAPLSATSNLAGAIVRFRHGFSSLAPVLDVVIDAASSTDPAIVAKAKAILAGLVDLMTAIADTSAWAGSASGDEIPTAVAAAYTIVLTATISDTKKWEIAARVAPENKDVTVTSAPVGPGAPLLVQIAIDHLSVLAVPSATSTVAVVRNADLMSGLTTETAFVYQPAEHEFPGRVTPALDGSTSSFDIAELTGITSGTLTEYLTALLKMMFEPGTASNNSPVMSMEVAYCRQAHGEPADAGVWVCSPVTRLSPTLSLTGEPQLDQTPLPAFATALAGMLTAWAQANDADIATGQFTFSIVLRSGADGALPPLAVLPKLTLELSRMT